jgi:DNA-binding NarL/FixJ family response regulator
MIAFPQLIREGICKILETEKYLNIVAEASTHQEIIPLVEQNKPDVLFFDTIICDSDILKLLRSIEEKSPKTKILLLIHAHDGVSANAISPCVQGYLTAVSGATDLIDAIRVASNIRVEKKDHNEESISVVMLEWSKLEIFESKPGGEQV